MKLDEVKVKKIKGRKATEILALSGNPDKFTECLEKTIKYGSDAKYEDLGMDEQIKLFVEINKKNGIDQDFIKTLGLESGS